jgi:hypothetical protein
MKKSKVLNELLQGYVHVVAHQIGQTAACNRLHHLDERCCRWPGNVRNRMRSSMTSKRSKVGDMTIEHLAKRSGSHPGPLFRGHERRRAARHEREPANESMKIRLREALAREEVLLRQNDKLMQKQKVLSKLFASQENAANRVASPLRESVKSWAGSRWPPQ